ncbi:glycosyl hydrolase family 18 protein [Psychromonas algarum]|uniref:glycosyl hydrolase family 18 protein n=1 Tax=Psychromonas algarum TaxID=2555643 RepID=UPI0010683F15|nr:glycosyl hydrolase family 18 protein [Psychromonas sp. RZ22]
MQLFTNKKSIQCLIICAFSLSLISCKTRDFIRDNWTKDPVVCDADTTPVDFKQIAYLSDLDEDVVDEIDFSMLTHIIYDKIAVNADGTLEISSDLDNDLDDLMDAVTQANTGTLVLFSIGSSGSEFKAIANSSSATLTFKRAIKSLFDDYSIDGIDINWQFPSAADEDDFETLIESIEETVHDENKLLSFVVNAGDDSSLTDAVSDDALEHADFINILTLEKANNDSDDNLEDMKESVVYWKEERCIVKNKLVVAIPAQGVSTDGQTKTFEDIFTHKNSDVCLDRTAARTFYYYNGIPTATDKTQYAQSSAGGVALISLENDLLDPAHINDYSLLMTIDSQVNGTPNTICP